MLIKWKHLLKMRVYILVEAGVGVGVGTHNVLRH